MVTVYWFEERDVLLADLDDGTSDTGQICERTIWRLSCT